MELVMCPCGTPDRVKSDWLYGNEVGMWRFSWKGHFRFSPYVLHSHSSWMDTSMRLEHFLLAVPSPRLVIILPFTATSISTVLDALSHFVQHVLLLAHITFYRLCSYLPFQQRRRLVARSCRRPGFGTKAGSAKPTFDLGIEGRSTTVAKFTK